MNIRETALLRAKEAKEQYKIQEEERVVRIKEQRTQELKKKIKRVLFEIDLPEDTIVQFRDDLVPFIEIEGILFSLAYDGPYDYALITIEKCIHCQEYVQRSVIDSWEGLGTSFDPSWQGEYIFRHKNGRCTRPKEDKAIGVTTPETKSPLDTTIRELFQQFMDEQ